MKKPVIHIGCSAFNNVYWKGIFYPEKLPRSKWFEFYTQHFDTYELNGTFYRMPTVKSLESWHDKVPDDFRFSIKAPKIITHIKRFVDCDAEISEFYTACRGGLKDKLGGVLFQLPPSFDFSMEKLELVLNALDTDFKNVIEFRHKTWWRQDVYDTLNERNVIFCSVSYPDLPEDIVSKSDCAYIRLHGRPKLFYSGYETEELEGFCKVLSKNDECTELFVYFNNTASTAGILNALELQKLLSNYKE